MTAGVRQALAALALAAWAGAAAAHSPVPGVGHFYAGMLHPLVVPAHLLALAACGLWLGPRWPAAAPALAALLLALPAGMALAATATWRGAETAVLALAATVALAAAADRGAGRLLPVGMAVLLGLALGLDSWPDGLRGRPLGLSLAGTWLSALMLPAALVVLADRARRPWMRLALRVVASWLAAAAVLVLALAARGTPPAG